MDAIVNNITEKLKEIKGIKDDTQDITLNFVVESVVQEILDYCHLEVSEWPTELNNTAVKMALQSLNDVSLMLKSDSLSGDTKSITEGDFSITKETRADVIQKLAKIDHDKSYKRTLNRYRKLAN